jgi:hypothetical protein
MRDPATVLFVAAVLCVVTGMGWGIQMSVIGDHSLAIAHAHLNLVGWVTLALFAVYYRLTPAANASRLARVQAVVAILGTAVMVPGIVVVVGGGPAGLAAAGSALSVTSAVLFLVTVLCHGFGRQATRTALAPDHARAAT